MQATFLHSVLAFMLVSLAYAIRAEFFVLVLNHVVLLFSLVVLWLLRELLLWLETKMAFRFSNIM